MGDLRSIRKQKRYRAWKPGEPVNTAVMDVITHPKLQRLEAKMTRAFIQAYTSTNSEQLQQDFYRFRKQYFTKAKELYEDGECEKNGEVYLHRVVGDLSWLDLEHVYKPEELKEILRDLGRSKKR
jgi:hypothetical protein